MGLGDNLMATGLAKGAAARGKRVAFGDGRKIIWDHHSEQIFRGNPNVFAPGEEHPSLDAHWIPFYRGNRIYNRQEGDRWVWNLDFHATPGEVYLSADEIAFAKQFEPGFVVIEPNVPEFKTVAPNKQWPADRYHAVSDALRETGHVVLQFDHGGKARLRARAIRTPTFRHAVALLSRAALYIGPEGGMHHAAAAVGLPAVVLFGGFIPPSVTGYATHTNLTGGAVACGSLRPCEHCRAAMNDISVNDVMGAAARFLKVTA